MSVQSTQNQKEIMRQPQRVHKPFHRLNHHDRFFIGSKEFWKVGFCRYQQINKAAETAEEWGQQTKVRFISPWTVVRSDEYVNKKITPAQLAAFNESAVHRNEKNKKIIERYAEGRVPYTKEELEGAPYTGGKTLTLHDVRPVMSAQFCDPGQTHYVGDDCPGGHRLDGIEGNSGPIGCAGSEISRVEQPNSDNGVKGPTS